MAQKKLGFLEKLFSRKPKMNDADDDDDDDDYDDDEMRQRYKKQGSDRRHTVAIPTRQRRALLSRPTKKTNKQQTMTSATLQVDNPVSCEDAPVHTSETAAAMGKCSSTKISRSYSADTTAVVNGLEISQSRTSQPLNEPRQRKISTFRRSVKSRDKGQRPCVDVSRPLEFPATPESILDYHKVQPILVEDEERLMVELNQFQCLIDSLDIIKIIAKHSKVFEVGPAELWEEFFDFVEEVPSYDEVINFEVWQEFRDKRYA